MGLEQLDWVVVAVEHKPEVEDFYNYDNHH